MVWFGFHGFMYLIFMVDFCWKNDLSCKPLRPYIFEGFVNLPSKTGFTIDRMIKLPLTHQVFHVWLPMSYNTHKHRPQRCFYPCALREVCQCVNSSNDALFGRTLDYMKISTVMVCLHSNIMSRNVKRYWVCLVSHWIGDQYILILPTLYKYILVVGFK